jgi:hypothetical protein
MARAIVVRQDHTTAAAICQVDCRVPHALIPTSTALACLALDNLTLGPVTDCSSSTSKTPVSLCYATSTDANGFSCLSTVVPKQCHIGDASPTPCLTIPSSNTLLVGSNTITLSSPPTPTTVVGSTVQVVQTAGSSNTENTTQSRHLNAVSSSAAAGIGIGGALLGAACAGLILFFFSRRKNRGINSNQKLSQTTAGYAHHHLGIAGEVKQVIDVAGSGKVASASAGFEEFLPQPAEDGKITSATSQLRDRIKNHAQSYYHTELMQPGMVDLGAIQQLAQATKISAVRLQEAILNPQSRVAAIRLYLSWVVLSRCGIAADARDSLLPPEVALFSAQLGDENSSDGQFYC